MNEKTTHGFGAEIRTRHGKVRVCCNCGEQSKTTTKRDAYKWFRTHAGGKWSAWDSVFGGF